MATSTHSGKKRAKPARRSDFTPEAWAERKRLQANARQLAWQQAHPDRDRQKKWRAKNPHKAAEYSRKYRKKNVESNKRSRRKAWLRDKYGLTPEQVNEQRRDQLDRCKICDAEFKPGRNGMHIDHSHETGRFRGLLCGKCNVGLGQFRDSPQLLRQAAKYLESVVC